MFLILDTFIFFFHCYLFRNFRFAFSLFYKNVLMYVHERIVFIVFLQCFRVTCADIVFLFEFLCLRENNSLLGGFQITLFYSVFMQITMSLRFFFLLNLFFFREGFENWMSNLNGFFNVLLHMAFCHKNCG